MRVQKTWIYAHISEPVQRDLILCQKKLLFGSAESMNFDVCGFTNEITKGISLSSKEIRDLMIHIRRRDFEILLIYDWTRFAIHYDRYIEIKMFCNQPHITVLALQDIEHRILK